MTEVDAQPLRFPQHLVTIGSDALRSMAGSTRSLKLAVVLSDDGFEVARAPWSPERDGRFASMASSAQALGEALVHELSLGSGDAMIVQASGGAMIQMRVPGNPFVIAAHFGEGESLGTALAAVRITAQSLATALAHASTDIDPAPTERGTT